MIKSSNKKEKYTQFCPICGSTNVVIQKIVKGVTVSHYCHNCKQVHNGRYSK
jgi:transposase-like protein